MSKILLPHQQRVIEEQEQLKERLNKLDSFLSNGQSSYITNEDWHLLNQQFGAMTHYLYILDVRISRFKGEN